MLYLVEDHESRACKDISLFAGVCDASEGGDIYDPLNVHMYASYSFKFYSSNFNVISNYKMFLIIVMVNFNPVRY